MRIQKISAKYFRSLSNFSFSPKPINVICGRNSSGKSNILRALRLAFKNGIDATRIPGNLTLGTGPNTQCSIELEFDKPTAALASAFQLPANTPFTYKFKFKRNGKWVRELNDVPLNPEEGERFISHFLVVYVPAIRDIEADGLEPFKNALLASLSKRGPDSLPNVNSRVRTSIARHGKALLEAPNAIAKEWVGVDGFVVDSTKVAVDAIARNVEIHVRVGAENLSLSRLGTGHQSAVILKLYRDLGKVAGQAVIYLFEEPDNHLHPTSIGVVAQELKSCATGDSQVFATTHSPYFLNQFDFANVIRVYSDETRRTHAHQISLSKPPRLMRTLLGQFGLKPAEALLAKRVVVVEGPNDVSSIRAFIEMHTGALPEHGDILVVPAGGKGPAVDLCSLLQELGAEWRVLLDWDAVHATDQPMLLPNLQPAQIRAAQNAIGTLLPLVHQTGTKTPRALKTLNALTRELGTPFQQRPFEETVIGKISWPFLGIADRAALQAAVLRGQPRVVNSILAKANTYLWKDDLETALVPIGHEAAAEAHLLARNLIPSVFPQAIRRQQVLARVKRMSHEPEQVFELVRALWQGGSYARQEVGRALQYLLG